MLKQGESKNETYIAVFVGFGHMGVAFFDFVFSAHWHSLIVVGVKPTEISMFRLDVGVLVIGAVYGVRASSLIVIQTGSRTLTLELGVVVLAIRAVGVYALLLLPVESY